MYYVELHIGPVNTTFGWLYSANPSLPSCAVVSYEVNVFTQNEIATNIHRDITAFRTFESTSKNITIASQFLMDSMSNSSTYFNLEALSDGSTCASSDYFSELFYNGKVP